MLCRCRQHSYSIYHSIQKLKVFSFHEHATAILTSNYCYNNLLILFHQFHSTLHEINETKWKDKFICLWICGMISWSGMELWLASSIKTKVFNYGVKGYIFWAQSTPIPLQWNIPFVLLKGRRVDLLINGIGLNGRWDEIEWDGVKTYNP